MSETVQQYIERLLGQIDGQQPLKIQATTAKKIEHALKGVPPTKLRKRPAPEKWSIGEIIAHLADNEIIGGTRIRMILGAPGTAVPAYDQDAWAKSGHYEKRDARKSLEQFRVVRESNLALLKSLTAEQWKQHSVHPERGVETIERIVTLFAGHDVNHLKQIEGLAAGKKSASKKSGRKKSR
jgi:hypothetical protein